MQASCSQLHCEFLRAFVHMDSNSFPNILCIRLLSEGSVTLRIHLEKICLIAEMWSCSNLSFAKRHSLRHLLSRLRIKIMTEVHLIVVLIMFLK